MTDSGQEGSGTGAPDTGALTSGAAQEAHDRLVATRQDIQDAVSKFDSDVQSAVRHLKAPSHSDLGSSIFKVFVDVAVALIPEAEEAKAALEVGKELIKGFTDIMVDQVKEAAKDTAEGQEEWAKDELERKAKALKVAALDGAKKAAEGVTSAQLQHLAEQVLQAHPDLAGLDPTDKGNHMSLANRMGIPDPAKTNLGDSMLQRLQICLQAEVATVNMGMVWLGWPTDMQRLEYLFDEAERGQDAYQLVKELGGDEEYWKPYIQVYFMAGRDKANEAMMIHMEMHGYTPDPEDYRP